MPSKDVSIRVLNSKFYFIYTKCYIILMISIITVLQIQIQYIFKYICKYRWVLLFQVRMHLLTSDFGSSTLGERKFLKVFRNYTMLTTPPTFGIFRGVLDLNSSSLVGTRKT